MVKARVVDSHRGGTQRQLRAQAQSLYATSQHFIDTRGAWRVRVFASYPSGLANEAIIYWAENNALDQLGRLLIILECPESPLVQMDTLALEVFEEIVQFLPRGVAAQRNQLRVARADMWFRVVAPTVTFMTPDGWAALMIAVLSGLCWVLRPYLIADPFRARAIADHIDSIAAGVIGNAIFALAVLVGSWWFRLRIARTTRKVMMSHGN